MSCDVARRRRHGCNLRVATWITVIIVERRGNRQQRTDRVRANPDVRRAYLGDGHSSCGFVEAQDLHVFYGQSHVLHGVSLSIERGEAVGLLGRDGIGRTTLIRTLLGQLRAARRHHPRARHSDRGPGSRLTWLARQGIDRAGRRRLPRPERARPW